MAVERRSRLVLDDASSASRLPSGAIHAGSNSRCEGASTVMAKDHGRGAVSSGRLAVSGSSNGGQGVSPTYASGRPRGKSDGCEMSGERRRRLGRGRTSHPVTQLAAGCFPSNLNVGNPRWRRALEAGTSPWSGDLGGRPGWAVSCFYQSGEVALLRLAGLARIFQSGGGLFVSFAGPAQISRSRGWGAFLGFACLARTNRSEGGEFVSFAGPTWTNQSGG